MMRRQIVRALCSTLLATAAPNAAPHETTARAQFDVRAFGAKGDGTAIDSDAINRAIDAASAAGGGTVHFPAGTYASYSIRLRSHVGLHLDHGATLLAVSNITMREVSNAPIFLRLAKRMRGPVGAAMGKLRRVSISNVTVYDADPRYASIIAGVPGSPVEDVTLTNVRILYRGGLTLAQAAAQPAALVNTFFRATDGTGPREAYAVPEREAMYPEPSMFGVLPAYGFYVRHAAGVHMEGVEVGFMALDTRPAIVLEDVRDVELHRVRAEKAPGVPTLVLRDVEELRISHSPPLSDVHVKAVKRLNY